MQTVVMGNISKRWCVDLCVANGLQYTVKRARCFELIHFEKKCDPTKVVIVGNIQICILQINIQDLLFIFLEDW